MTVVELRAEPMYCDYSSCLIFLPAVIHGYVVCSVLPTLPVMCLLLIQLQILCLLLQISRPRRHMGRVLLGLDLFPSEELYSAGFPTRELGRVQLSEKPHPTPTLDQEIGAAAAECHRWLGNNGHLPLTVLEAGSPRSRPQQTQHLASETSFRHRCRRLAVSSHGGGERALWISLYKTVLLTGAPPHDPVTHRDPAFNTSTREVRIPTCEFGG